MYEQMELDVTLEGERELRENIDVAVSFACRQLQQSEPTKVTNKHEGYGIAAEAYSALAGSMKKVQGDMKTFLGILPADDSVAINTANSLYNSAVETVYQATLLAAQANRVMTDIYEAHKDDRTPLEEYAESMEDGDGFEEAQAGDPEEEAEDE